MEMEVGNKYRLSFKVGYKIHRGQEVDRILYYEATITKLEENLIHFSDRYGKEYCYAKDWLKQISPMER